MKVKVYEVIEKHAEQDRIIVVEETRKLANKQYKRLTKENKHKEYYIIKKYLEIE